MSTRRRRTNDLPLTMESVRRRIITVVRAVERETKQFIDKYSSNIGSPDVWPRYIDFICDRPPINKTPYQTMTDYKDLEPVLQKLTPHDELSRVEENYELQRMVERGKLFDYISFSLRNDLVSAFENQAGRYCLSFHDQAAGEDLESVKDYEKTISECRQQARQRLDRVDGLLDQVDRYKRSLPQYVENYTEVAEHMKSACRAMLDACEPLRRWVAADAKYATHIQEEISRCNKRKMDLADIVKQLEDQKEAQGQKLKKTTNNLAKLELQLKEAKDEKAYYRRREGDIEQSYIKTEADMMRKQHDVDEIRHKIKSRRENSPAVYNYLVGMREAIRDEIRAHQDKLNTMDKQIESLRKDQMNSQRQVDLYAAELEAGRSTNSEVQRQLAEQDDQIRLVRDDMDRQDRRIGVLRQIREVKLHSDTLKKIYHHGYRPQQIAVEQLQDEIHTAFRITAEDIGKDWVWLYQQLPFDPPRDYPTRQQDIEVIDLNHWRLDTGYALLAIKALEKWYRQSNVATVDELLATLRRLKRHKTISRIETELNGGGSGPDNRRQQLPTVRAVSVAADTRNHRSQSSTSRLSTSLRRSTASYA